MLQRLHVVFVAVLVLGSFGGWAVSFFGVDRPDAMWVIGAISWFGTSLFLAVLGIAIDRTCSVRGRHWLALGLASCVPLARIFIEVHMVSAMARTASGFVDDERIAARVRRLMIARVAVVISQSLVPIFLVVANEAPYGELLAMNWAIVMGAISFTTITLLVVATHMVVAPVVEALRDDARLDVGGAGARESVAVRTL